VVLTGEVGCGKTTITRALIDSLDDHHKIILIVNPCLSPSQLLRTIARRLDLDTHLRQKDELIDIIYENMFGLYERGITPVVIIDEAHLIPNRATFEEIRLLTNFQLDNTNLVSIILAGQPALSRIIAQEEFMALRQRIGLYYNLESLSQQETREYVLHRVFKGGRKDTLFSDDALELMFRYSEGVPRLINSIATAALLEGVGREAGIIDAYIIEEAARELMLKPSPPEDTTASWGPEAGDQNMENQNKKARERNGGELPTIIYL
jgi:type II secretory pathway predicted ATPase ExeA